MAAETEPAKLLLPYLQRADELQKHEPLVAYYCRLYAMERGLKFPQRTKTTNSILASLMKQLEKDKKSLSLGPDDHLHLEGFAMNVFAKADKQDRAGRADISTAKTFYAASLFFEILNQFGDPPLDIEQKQKYAVWKAADIRKAIKEGRKPVPGPPGGEDDYSVSSSTPSSYDLEPGQPKVDPYRGQEPDPSPPPEYEDKMKRQSSVNLSPQAPSFPSDYPTQDYQSPHTSGGFDNRNYSQQYNHPTYPEEPPPHTPQPHHQPTYPEEPPHPPQQHMPPNNFPSQEIPPGYSYANFQSYPSFTEGSLPPAAAASPHHSSFYQGPDPSYSRQPSQSAMNYPSGPTYNPTSTNGSASAPEPAPAPAQTYVYDSNYQPPPDKIAEAHKAARFAVGALAFDDVSIAVDFLKKSLDLLTNPSAGQ